MSCPTELEGESVWNESLACCFPGSEISSPLSHPINRVFSSLILCLFMWFLVQLYLILKCSHVSFASENWAFPSEQKITLAEFKAYPSVHFGQG